MSALYIYSIRPAKSLQASERRVGTAALPIPKRVGKAALPYSRRVGLPVIVVQPSNALHTNLLRFAPRECARRHSLSVQPPLIIYIYHTV